MSNNDLPFYLSGHNNDLLVLEQWKGASNRIKPSFLGHLKKNALALRARSLFSEKVEEGKDGLCWQVVVVLVKQLRFEPRVSTGSGLFAHWAVVWFKLSGKRKENLAIQIC